MRIILHQDVGKLGKLGEVVRVRPGFARNYLIPRGLAERASEAAIADFESRRADLTRAQEERLGRLRGDGEALAGRRVLLAMKAAPDGKLYGSVGTRALAAALADDGVAVDKNHIRIDGGAIKAVGEYAATVVFAPEVTATIAVVVYPEGAPPPPATEEEKGEKKSASSEEAAAQDGDTQEAAADKDGDAEATDDGEAAANDGGDARDKQ
jgi:large subunit ribosomal protein L9